MLHLTEWREFRELDPAALGEVVARAGCILDGRNALDPALWRKAGLDLPGDGPPERLEPDRRAPVALEGLRR